MIKTGFKPKGMATAIGSLPCKDAREAAKLMLDCLTQMPAWPQLPKMSFKENMYVQYSEGFPAVILNEDRERITFDTTNIDGLEEFYRKYLEEDLESFAISSSYASGFYAFLEEIKRKENKPPIIKGQVTGPISFGLSVKDQDNKGILFNEQFADVIVKGLSLKAKWQEKVFNKVAPNSKTVIFFDEPYLVSFGSAFVSLNEKDVLAKLDECFSAVSGLSGIHVCGGTDWGLIMETKVDIIHFDAYAYFESMTLYPNQLKGFLSRGGVLAWGITPHTSKIESETSQSLFEQLQKKILNLIKLGVDEEMLLEQSLIAPSCGAGSLSLINAKRALILTKEVSELFRKHFFD